MPSFLAPDVVQRVEDIHAVLERILLGTFQSLRIDHRQHLILVVMLPFPRIPDDSAPSHTSDPLTETEHRIDVGLEVSPSVPSEDELVGVDVDVLVPQPVERAVAPSLEVREDPMNPRQNDVGRWRIDGAKIDGVVATIRHSPVGGVAVSVQHASNCRVVLDEGVQAFAVDVDDPLQTASSGIFPLADLDGPDHENLADWTAALTAALRFILRPERDIGLIDLDVASKRFTIRIDHRPPELVEEQPGGLVSDAELRLELES